MTKRRIHTPDAYASNFFAGGPGGASSGPTPNNPGLFLPWSNLNIQDSENATAIGVANQQQFWQFVPDYNVQIGHVTFDVTTLLAGAKAGFAIYSGDLTQKLTSADAIDCSTTGVKRIAASSVITLLANTSYWLGFVATDGTTLQILNALDATAYASIKSAAVVRQGRDTVDATAGGVTLAAPVNIANITSLQLRTPTNFWDL